MGKFFVNSDKIENENITITGEDVNHIKNVLRLKVDSDIKICDKDSGINYICNIEEIGKEKIICKILKVLDEETESNVEIHIFQGLPKSDKMEYIIQKGTELGAVEFIPVNLKRCIVKLSGKDEEKKIERWQKIAEVAAKQSIRDRVPKVKNIQCLKNVCNLIPNYDIVLVAYEEESSNFIKSELLELKKIKENYKIAVIIGPEGGLEKQEVDILKEAGARSVGLGKRILRTETASLYVLTAIMYELEKIN